MNPRPHSSGGAASALHDAWVALALLEPWHWTATLTFKPEYEGSFSGVHPEKADKAHRFWISSLNRAIWGPRWSKRSCARGGIKWLRGQEFHKSGAIHYHCLVAAPTFDLDDELRRMWARDVWVRNFGWAQIEQPRSQNDVAGYCCKYVVKDGEIDVSRNFRGFVAPPFQLSSPDSDVNGARATVASNGPRAGEGTPSPGDSSLLDGIGVSEGNAQLGALQEAKGHVEN